MSQRPSHSESNSDHQAFMQLALDEARKAMDDDVGGPFGAVIVKAGHVLARGRNQVLSLADPTAHAEVQAIRAAATQLKVHDLSGTILYTSCEPCPMCLAASYWARVDAIWYAGSQQDAASIGFDDNSFYQQIALPPVERSVPMTRILGAEGAAILKGWGSRGGRTLY